ncbi:acetyl-CoA acetyltransferase [Nocardia sp. CDC160]|uniref:thiolase family protein n=1 Tax=Nocardia sp. CDC160 TaxID=3112166 RepID=UPI002DB8238B|nr:acetyl-CoA acetyltransferase [Nocardia sp. CDC160]MEC3914244.1 acetyl-CoA acetyltransferase [Nocardia sp. CDC160]
MRRAAIVMPMRTPLGRTGGALAAVPPDRLIATVLSAVLGRAGLDPRRVEQLVTATPDAEAVLAAATAVGLPSEVGDFAIGDGPGAGLRALITASMLVHTGAADVVLAVGAEYTSVPAYAGAPAESMAQPPSAPRPTAPPRGADDTEPTTDEQIAIWAATEPQRGQADSLRAERLAHDHGLTRGAADDFAAASHRRAARAHRQGIFGTEIAPVVVCADPHDPDSAVVQLVDRDEGLRDDVSARAFAALAPFLPNGVTTAANSSTPGLAASACLVVAEDRLVDLGLEPLGYLVDWASAAAPADAPIPATTPAVSKTLWRSGFQLADLELLEVEETSAIDVLALTRSLGLPDYDPDLVNVHGGAIALGDPGGAAGLRMITTMLHELSRRDGGLGLAVSATGAGGAVAALFESPNLEPVAQAPLGARFRGAGSRRPGRGRHRH